MRRGVTVTLTIQDLAAVRFSPDPVWEVAAALRVLRRPRRHPLHRPLVQLVRNPTYDLALLLDLVADPRTEPRFLRPDPRPVPRTAASALASVAATDVADAERDLQRLAAGAADPRRWRRMSAAQLVEQASTALTGFWRSTLDPFDQRMQALIAADLAHRGRVLAGNGVAVTLADLHESLSWAGDGLRLASAVEHHDRPAGGRGLWLVPSLFCWPELVVDLCRPVPVIAFPARGAGLLWETPTRARRRGDGLQLVLGRSRREILTALATPATTTRLARALDLSPGTVSAHLGALVQAGLLRANRHGREVYYERTSLGHSLTADESAAA
jgi:DNA-binding transcriptional ArsR family regulator